MKNKKIENKIEKIFFASVVVLLTIVLTNTIIIGASGNILKKKVEEIKEFNKPLKIELSIITCDECSDISSIVETIKNKNVEVINEETLDVKSEKAQQLITESGLEKIPSIIISGEIDNEKVNFGKDFELKGGSLALTNVNAPFLELSSNEVKGLVEIIEITDSSCEECVPLDYIPTSFSQSGVKISDWKKVEYDSEEGSSLLNQFGIKKVPAILISKEIDYYSDASSTITQLGPSDKGEFYGLHSIIPPFRDLDQNKIVGLVELILLSDKSCSECYDVNINKQILLRMGIIPVTESSYDVSSSEGQNLISKYGIEKAPMILVSPEAEAYNVFVQAWEQIGSVEDDGWFIMKSPENLGVVKDLSSGEVIEQ